jgi:hypothetical protein
MNGKREVSHSSAGRDRILRETRFSDAGREKTGNGSQVQRKSRAGQDSHPSGNYVRKPVREPARHLAPEEGGVEDAPQQKQATVTLPPLRFLEKKKIAGEWL